MKGIPRIKSVQPLNDMIVVATFANGIKKQYDIKQLTNRFPVFNELKDKHLFNLAHVDCGGYGISWNDYIDLSEYEIWENGKLLK
ncbi:MAG: DUF2442 domain-containing protein [Lentisphaerota bacterium]